MESPGGGPEDADGGDDNIVHATRPWQKPVACLRSEPSARPSSFPETRKENHGWTRYTRIEDEFRTPQRKLRARWRKQDCRTFLICVHPCPSVVELNYNG